MYSKEVGLPSYFKRSVQFFHASITGLNFIPHHPPLTPSKVLDLIYRLVKPSDENAGKEENIVWAEKNSHSLLGDLSLLVELLEHTDMVVGITSSQLLTEMHSNCGSDFEKALLDCPGAITKLLQRLSDSSKVSS